MDTASTANSEIPTADDRATADDGAPCDDPAPKGLIRGLAAAAGAVSLVAMIGWFGHIHILTTVVPGLVTMKFNAALTMTVLSVTFFLPRRVALASSISAGTLATLTLIEYATSTDLGIDNLLIIDRATATHPGRMALTTACCLLLLALSITLNRQGRRRFVQPTATAVLTLSVLMLLGYLYGVPELIYFGLSTTLALQTTVAFTLLSTAVLLDVDQSDLWWMRRGRDVGATMLRTLLPWTLLALPLIGSVQLLGQRAGWFDEDFGLALTVGTAALVLTLVIWKAARTLATVDRRRTAALADLRILSDELEQRVRSRTAELEAEREGLRVAEAGARAAQAEAEAANAAKSGLLSRVSHELRTPLNAIIGFAQLLELDAVGDQEEAVGHILRGGQHLLAMINDVLDITGIESARLEMNSEPVQLSALVSETVGLIGLLATAQGIEVITDPEASDAGGCVQADRRRLQQVLLNLLSNAIKYNRQNGRIHIRIRPTANDQLSIAVSDTGIGILPADLPRLFTPFDRLGRQSSNIEGTGLGLALSKRFTTMMGGRLDVESAPGEGSTFTVTMPIAGPAARIRQVSVEDYPVPATT